jgi:hypothetical protein
VDVAAVWVTGLWPIEIAHLTHGDMRYFYGMENEKTLWETEGFDSREAMDDWFRKVVKPGEIVTKHLMRFRLNENSPSTGATE